MTYTDQQFDEASRWLDLLLDVVTYRDRWHFDRPKVAPVPGALEVIVCYRAPDVHAADPDAVVFLEYRANVTREALDRNESAVMQVLWHAISQLEGHERMEFLKVRGAPAFDPHPHGRYDVRFSPTDKGRWTGAVL